MAWQNVTACYTRHMSITLPAIRRGDTLMLLQHLEGIPEGAPVSVTITPESEREAWYRAGDDHFDTAFGDDEPDYTQPDTTR